MSKRKRGGLPDPRVFQQLPISQAASFDRVAQRTYDGDVVEDPDGTYDVPFQDLKYGQKVVESITVSQVEQDLFSKMARNDHRPGVSKLLQFAVNLFPINTGIL